MSEATSGDAPGSREVLSRVEHLSAGADRRWQALVEGYRRAGLDPDAAASPAVPRGPRERALGFRDHARSFLLPRARDLDAALLVAIVGPTGSGKSTLLNTLAGANVSRTGVLRPTTRDAVAVGAAPELAHATDVGALADIPRDRLEQQPSDDLPGLVLVDTPDVDSVEREDRALADRLLEAADLCVFVTTATRYADQVPWEVLRRAEERRLELIVVLNRMPSGADASFVLADLERLTRATELRISDVLSVPEGALAADGASLAKGAIAPLRERLTGLSADRAQRRRLAVRALEGSLAGISPLVAAVADDLDAEVRHGRALLAQARAAYADETETMQERLFSGSLLREQVIGEWHAFVGADQVTRFFAGGIGRLRGAVASIFRGAPRAPVAQVKRGATDDITALVERHAAEAARRSSSHWSSDPRGSLLVSAKPELWSSSDAIAEATHQTVDAWVAAIATDVAERGTGRRSTARAAALGVNALSISLVLVTFTHTGGLTGAEAGIAAATAYLNQKLLNALFGEAAVQDMIGRARQRLSEGLGQVLAGERQRFEDAVGDVGELEQLAAELRALGNAQR